MVSIITVNYKVKDKLLASIDSVVQSKPVTKYEIIVIDNSRDEELEFALKKNYKAVKYIPNKNTGFGAGNNLGAREAHGQLLIFLNPDTVVGKYAIDNLVKFYQNNKMNGIAAPILLGKDGKPYQQGSRELTPLRALFVLSFINKFFPNNPVSKKYFLRDWDKKSVVDVDVAPGTAFIISKLLFNKLNGFDEKFFLFFEEFDLCRRVRKAGYKINIMPEAKVMHYWGESTKQNKDIKKIFSESRFYYFRKHFGIWHALAVETFLRLNKKVILGIATVIALLMLVILYLA